MRGGTGCLPGQDDEWDPGCLYGHGTLSPHFPEVGGGLQLTGA